MTKKLFCIKCGSLWKPGGSPSVCPDCSAKEKKQVISCAIVKEVPDECK